MTLEEILKQYDKDWGFRFRSKAKHLLKRSRKYCYMAVAVAGLNCMLSAGESLMADRKKTHENILYEAHAYNRINHELLKTILWAVPFGLLSYGMLYGACKKKDFVNEHYILLQGATLYGLSLLPQMFLQEPLFKRMFTQANALGELALAMTAMTLFTSLATGSLKRIKPPRLKNYIRMLYIKDEKGLNEIFDAPEYVIKRETLSNQLQKDPEQFFKITDVFTDFLSIEYYRDPNLIPTSISKETFSFIIVLGRLLKNKPETIINYADFAKHNEDYITMLEEIDRLGEIESISQDAKINSALFFDTFIQTIRDDPNHFNAYALKKLFTKFPDPDKEIHERWEKVIDELIKSPNTLYRNVYRNRVRCISNSKFLEGTLLVKTGEEKELFEEMAIAHQVYEAVKDIKGFEVVRPVTILQHKGEWYYPVIRQRDCTSLFDDSSIEIMQKSAKFLKLIHDNVESVHDRRDYGSVLEQRIKSKSELMEIFYDDEFQQLFKNIGSDFRYDKDPHGGQWFFNDDKVVALDFSDKGNLQVSLQLNKFMVENFMKGEHYNEILACYEGYDEQEYLNAMPISALSYIANPMYKGMDPKAQREAYVRNAVMACDKLSLSGLRDMFEKI